MVTWGLRLPEQPLFLTLLGMVPEEKSSEGFPSAVKCAGLEITRVTSACSSFAGTCYVVCSQEGQCCYVPGKGEDSKYKFDHTDDSD